MLLLAAVAAQAQTLTIASGLARGSDITVETFFGFKSKTGKAWVQIHVGEWNGDSYNWERARHINVEGLSYNKETKTLTYQKQDGSVVNCGRRNIFAAYHLKLTGNCSLKKINQGNSTSVVLTIK